MMTTLLKLQHIADSALPIGGAAHSFGLESLVDSGLLDTAGIEAFLLGYLDQAGTMEAAYSIASTRLAASGALDHWLRLNVELSARKTARESREGSAAMGRRFLALAAQMTGIDLLRSAADRAMEVHLAACFGFVAGAIEIAPEPSAAAYLQQSVTALLSCCQRLLPLGQTRAHQILWSLQPAIVRAARNGDIASPGDVSCFTPLLDAASARHAGLHTRLFMS